MSMPYGSRYANTSGPTGAMGEGERHPLSCPSPKASLEDIASLGRGLLYSQKLTHTIFVEFIIQRVRSAVKG
jgi:hypothetical protein